MIDALDITEKEWAADEHSGEAVVELEMDVRPKKWSSRIQVTAGNFFW